MVKKLEIFDNNQHIKNLYERLKKAGFTKKYLKEAILPDWWDDEIAKTQTGFNQLIYTLAKNLNLDIDSLRNNSSELKSHILYTKFKKKGTDKIDESYSFSVSIAQQIARYAVAALKTSSQKNFTKQTALDIRHKIFSNKENTTINFKNLVDFCFQHGIPVLHIPNLPSPKPEGMAFLFDKQPVIVITKKSKYPAWLLFILAHELGHICSEHLEKEGLWIDSTIKFKEIEKEELEANDFAVKLLSGFSFNYVPSNSLNDTDLANQANLISNKSQIDAGFIVLNYAYFSKNSKLAFSIANKALSLLSTEKYLPTHYLFETLCQYLDEDKLSKEEFEYVMRLTKPSDFNESTNLPD
jgi:Zn-dependent peptidase ImmA (M78 family)